MEADAEEEESKMELQSLVSNLFFVVYCIIGAFLTVALAIITKLTRPRVSFDLLTRFYPYFWTLIFYLFSNLLFHITRSVFYIVVDWPLGEFPCRIFAGFWPSAIENTYGLIIFFLCFSLKTERFGACFSHRWVSKFLIGVSVVSGLGSAVLPSFYAGIQVDKKKVKTCAPLPFTDIHSVHYLYSVAEFLLFQFLPLFSSTLIVVRARAHRNNQLCPQLTYMMGSLVLGIWPRKILGLCQILMREAEWRSLSKVQGLIGHLSLVCKLFLYPITLISVVITYRAFAIEADETQGKELETNNKLLPPSIIARKISINGLYDDTA